MPPILARAETTDQTFFTSGRLQALTGSERDVRSLNHSSASRGLSKSDLINDRVFFDNRTT
jgi:hypothetical protein